MAIAAEKAARETLATTFVLDGDVHLNESPAELAEYAEPPWDIALREIATIGGGYLSLPGMSPKADYRVPWPGGQNRSQVVTNAADMRRELDDLHVDVAVLFPDNLLTLPMVRDPRFALVLAQAYNAWMCERWLSSEPSLRGALVACPQRPQESADDIRRHAGHPGVCCVYLPACGLRPLYGDRQYEPIWKAATETGLPVAIHSVEAVFPAFPFQLDCFETSLAQHALAHPLSMISNLVSLLETGVPMRWPEIRWGFMEAGVGWVPWIANRLDKEYLERRREVPHLRERPSHYIRQFFFGTQPIEEPVERGDIVKVFALFDGEHTAVFASDWPHHDFDHPQHVFGLPFSAEARRAILGGNGARFYGIGIPEQYAAGP